MGVLIAGQEVKPTTVGNDEGYGCFGFLFSLAVLAMIVGCFAYGAYCLIKLIAAFLLGILE